MTTAPLTTFQGERSYIWLPCLLWCILICRPFFFNCSDHNRSQQYMNSWFVKNHHVHKKKLQSIDTNFRFRDLRSITFRRFHGSTPKARIVVPSFVVKYITNYFQVNRRSKLLLDEFQISQAWHTRFCAVHTLIAMTEAQTEFRMVGKICMMAVTK